MCRTQCLHHSVRSMQGAHSRMCQGLAQHCQTITAAQVPSIHPDRMDLVFFPQVETFYVVPLLLPIPAGAHMWGAPKQSSVCAVLQHRGLYSNPSIDPFRLRQLSGLVLCIAAPLLLSQHMRHKPASSLGKVRAWVGFVQLGTYLLVRSKSTDLTLRCATL